MDNAFQELLAEFLLEAGERADAVEAAMLALLGTDVADRRQGLAQVKRELHTLKGNAGMMGFGDLQQIAHGLEDQIESLDVERPQIDAFLATVDDLRGRLHAIAEPEDAAAAGSAPGDRGEAGEPADGDGDGDQPLAVLTGASERSVRVSFAKIDRLVDLLAETLIFRNRLTDAVVSGLAISAGGDDPAAVLERSRDAWERVELAHQALEKTLNALQEHVTELGMVPLRLLFRSLGRIVHDESQRAGKDVDFEIEGGDTPIDKTLIEVAAEALGHLVRNAVIHGIELPAERRQEGKPAKGIIRLRAEIEGGEVRIEVRDDGAGIDREAVLRQAGSRLTTAAGERRTALELLFEEGVSTHGDADLSAGRGVGLSAVKRSVERRGGRIEVRSEPGLGSAFTLHVPLTASILRSLLLAVDGETYALPMSAVAESLRLTPEARHEVNHAGVLQWRDQLVPLLDLGLAFGTCERPRTEGYAVIIDVNGRARALATDDIVGIRDIVVKGLDPIVGQPVGISGSTILGDGRVVMILDPASLVTVSPFVETGR